MPELSVIIPVFNRFEMLLMTLLHLNRQTLPTEQYEVIVVDDGSSTNIQEMTDAINTPYQMSVLRQDHRGPAAARNLGVKYARGEILVFLDSDMLVNSDFLEKHLHAHPPDSCLLVEGQRQIHLSRHSPMFMQIIDIDTNPRKTPIEFPEILTCNLSVSKSIFDKIGEFDETLITWEDVEFGFRAKLAGFKLVHLPEAIAFHEHPLSFQQFCEKQMEHHRLAWRFFNLHPEAAQSFDYLHEKLPVDHSTDSFRILIRKYIRHLLALPPILRAMEQSVSFLENRTQPKKVLRFLYWKIIGSYQLIGLQEGLNDNKAYR